MKFAKDFVILRNLTASGRISIPMDRNPIMVATMINEAMFADLGNAILHHKTVFLEDRIHDWDWQNGKFRYYTRIAKTADVLVVYEAEEVRFCEKCGAKKTNLEASCKECASAK